MKSNKTCTGYTNGILAMLIVLADCLVPLESAEWERILKEDVLVLLLNSWNIMMRKKIIVLDFSSVWP